MKIDYKIEEVRPNVFAVIVKDHYHRAMLFLRVQEFYESPNPEFRGKNFNIWDYIEWYSRRNKDVFTYPFDWGGFNIPLKTAWDCYEKLSEYESPYDAVMDEIIRTIEMTMFNKKNTRNWNGYIIGAPSTDDDTFEHEVCHGLYATNKQYRELVDEVTIAIPPKEYNIFRNNLFKMGYNGIVIDDEIQAYLSTNYDYSKFSKGVNRKLCKELHKQYKQIFNLYENI
jgi:hypothetical protein